MHDSTRVRLMQQVKAGGCASKLAPGSLAAVLSRLPKQSDPNLVVGFDTSDNAGIYRIAPDVAPDRRGCVYYHHVCLLQS
jgi:selenide, water dikinase